MNDEGFEKTLSSVIGNDALMGKIADIMNKNGGDKDASLSEVISVISSSLGNGEKEEIKEEAKSEQKDDAEAHKVFSEGRHGAFSGLSYSRNSELLTALKPYLSDKRAEMVDSLLKIEKIAEIMKIAR